MANRFRLFRRPIGTYYLHDASTGKAKEPNREESILNPVEVALKQLSQTNPRASGRG